MDYSKELSDKQENLEAEDIRTGLLFSAGYLLMLVQNVIENPKEQDISCMKDLLCTLSDSNFEPGSNTKDTPFYKALRNLRNYKEIVWVVEPDPLCEESLINLNIPLDFDAQSAVGRSEGKLYIRWTLPRPEFVLEATDVNKLANCSLVVIEELLHLIQRWDSDYINLLSSFDEDLRLPTNSKNPIKCRRLLQLIMETDVHNFIKHYVYVNRKDNILNLDWFTKRENAHESDIHRPLNEEDFLIACACYVIVTQKGQE